MTVIPAGAQLAPADLPPPPPSADPREPSPAAARGRSSRTPQRARSPAPGYHPSHSRGSSPTRPPVHHASSVDSPPIASPIPRPAGALGAGSPIPPPLNPFHHSAPHLSRPSSPSSVHSSTSAIFERDIELPAVATLSINPHPTGGQHTLQHKASRLSQFSHGSPLDHTVPSVLDDAVEALAGARTTSGGIEGLEIEGPAPSTGGIGMARQSSASLHGIGPSSRKASMGPGGIATIGSRSPSPISVASRTSSGIISPAQSPPIHSQLGSSQTQMSGGDLTGPSSLSAGISGSVPRPAMPQRVSTGPQLPGGWAFGHGSSADKGQEPMSEGLAEVDENEVSPSPPMLPTQSSSPPVAIPSHLTPTKDKRRISFISPNDLLLSVPTTVTPLGEITSGALSPDHLPGTVSPSVPARSPVLPSSLSPGIDSAFDGRAPEIEHKPSWDAGSGGRPGGLGLGEGEWQREGLGRGLEQRLEDLAREDGHSNPVSPVGK